MNQQVARAISKMILPIFSWSSRVHPLSQIKCLLGADPRESGFNLQACALQPWPQEACWTALNRRNGLLL